MGLPNYDSNPTKVLLVEDNLVNQKVTMILLERLGLDVELANNGQEALKAYSRGDFSLILMDCHMPIMDGFEATVAIRKMGAQTGVYTPIIAVTALAMSGDRERCIASGMDDYLSKPINPQVLKLKINHWMQADVVYRSQKISRKFWRPDCQLSLVGEAPINLDELIDFYGDELHTILDIFNTKTEKEIRSLEFYIREKRAIDIGAIAHEMKASAAAIGAKHLAKFALYLEQAAGQEDWLEASVTLQLFQQAFMLFKEFILRSSLHRPVAEQQQSYAGSLRDDS
ncbi:MAG: response regulator [Candidatus Obscuribacterales bacterium]|nr:response regulator [Candidatus Obscuribacterales bacterium]